MIVKVLATELPIATVVEVVTAQAILTRLELADTLALVTALGI